MDYSASFGSENSDQEPSEEGACSQTEGLYPEESITLMSLTTDARSGAITENLSTIGSKQSHIYSM